MAHEQAPGGSPSPDTTGATRIAPQVVRRVVALAARDVPGVHATTDSPTRALAAVRAPRRGPATPGVRVEVGSTEVAVGLDVVLDYDVPLIEVTRALREAVITAVERTVGLRVPEVDITVHDVHPPGAAESDEPATSDRPVANTRSS